MDGGGRGFRLGRGVETVTEATEQIKEARPRRFHRYPEYKDSGVEWLREIPKDWEVKRLSWLAKCLDAKRIPLNAEERGRMQGDYPYWGANSIVDYVDKWLFDEELVLLGEDGAPFFDRSRPVAFRVKGKIWVNNHAHVLLPHSAVDAKFLAHALNCIDYRAFIDGSTRDKLTQSDMAAIPIQYPVVKEQRAITAFLDRETARIDGLVARKERLIELLQEKRASLITRAVTRGLDPNAPTKNSGVEWLGEIPAHWEVKPLKSISDLQTGLTLGKRYEGEALTTRPYLRVANVQDGYLALDDIAEVEVPVRDVGRFELRMGDVLMTEGGDFDKLGRGHVWKEQLAQCLHQNHIFAVRPRRSALTSHFLALVMSSAYGRAYFTATSKQSTNLASTNSTKLRNLPIPLPGLDDQVEITRWTDRETARIDALIAKVHQAIHHLKEFRTALISAAVTGKIDLREAAS